MANSLAYEWALANQGGTETLYKNINDFLAGTQAGQTGAPTLEQTQAAMSQYGVSPEDILAATGKAFESFYPTQQQTVVAPVQTTAPTQTIATPTPVVTQPNVVEVLESMNVAAPQSAGYTWATQDPQGVAAGGVQNYYSNINKFFADPTHTQADAAAAMQQYGISEADILAATGKTLDQIYAPPAPEQLANNPLLAKPYQEYKGTLTGGTMTPEVMQSLYGSVAPNFTKNVNNIASQILAQQAAGTDRYWYSGNTASNQNAAYDFAFRLAEKGVTDLSDLGLRTGTQDLGIDEFGNPVTQQTNELINKKTGESLGYIGTGNQWDSSYNLDLDYKIGFTEDGRAIPYTSNQASAWVDIREGLVKPAIAMLAGPLGYGAEVAAANAVYAASQGDWDRAITSALSAAVPIAQNMKLDPSTISSLQTAKQVANVLQALDNNNLLGAALGGADLAGISNVAGINVRDISQAVKVANAVLNADKNPFGLVNALMPYGKNLTTTDESPLSEEELAQRTENRWQKFLRNLPTEDTADADARTQELLAEWAASGDPNATSGISGDEFEDFLKSIGINTTTNFETSPTNQEILDAIGYENEQNLVVTTDRPVTTPPVTIPEIVVTTDRPVTTPPVTIPEIVVTTDRPVTTPPVTIPEIVITTDRPVTTPPATVPEIVITTDRPITTPPATVPEIVITTDRPVTTTPVTTLPVTTLPPTTSVVTTRVTQKVTVAPTSATTGFSIPQAQAVAATFGLPQLANVFYYGKDFGSKKQKLKDGEVEEEEYKPLSVTKAGAAGEALEEAEIAQAKKTKENDVNGLIEQILGKSQENVSLDELLNIVKGS